MPEERPTVYNTAHRPTRHVYSSGRILAPTLLCAVLLSGFRSREFTWDHLQAGAPPIAATLVLGWLFGSVIGPMVFDRLPGRGAASRGLAAGGLGLALWPAACLPLHVEPLDVTMAILIIPALSSLLTSCHLSPAGGRESISPSLYLQSVPLALAAGIWIMARFI